MKLGGWGFFSFTKQMYLKAHVQMKTAVHLKGQSQAVFLCCHISKVFSWRSVGTSVRQCRWAYGRQVFMSDIALGKNKMMFVTQEGEGFSGQWLGEYKKIVDKKGEAKSLAKHSPSNWNTEVWLNWRIVSSGLVKISVLIFQVTVQRCLATPRVELYMSVYALKSSLTSTEPSA